MIPLAEKKGCEVPKEESDTDGRAGVSREGRADWDDTVYVGGCEGGLCGERSRLLSTSSNGRASREALGTVQRAGPEAVLGPPVLDEPTVDWPRMLPGRAAGSFDGETTNGSEKWT